MYEVPIPKKKPENMVQGMMEDIDNLTSALRDSIKRPPKQVARNELEDGVIVSTLSTPDTKFETAIIDAKRRISVVERYNNVKDAVDGHNSWVKKIPIMDEVTDLGYGNTVEPQTRSLARKDGGE